MKRFLLLLLSFIILLVPVQSASALCGGQAPVILPRFPNENALYSLADLEPITPMNTDRLQIVSLLSVGRPAVIEEWLNYNYGPIWLSDQTTLLLPTTQGVFRYIPTQPEQPPYMLSNLPTAKLMLGMKGHSLLSMSMDGKQMHLWDVQKQAIVATAPISRNYFPNNVASDPQFVADQHVVALVDGKQKDEFIWNLYDPQTLDVTGSLATTDQPVTYYAVSPDVRYIIAATDTSNFLLNIEKNTVVAEWERAEREPLSYTSPPAQFSSDGQLLILPVEDAIQLWTVEETPIKVREIELEQHSFNVLSHQNLLVVLTKAISTPNHDYTLSLYDLESGTTQPLATIHNTTIFAAMSISPDGHWLIWHGNLLFDLYALLKQGGDHTYPDVPGMIKIGLEYSQPVGDNFGLREPYRLQFSWGCGWSPARAVNAITGEYDSVDINAPTFKFAWSDLPSSIPESAGFSLLGVAPNQMVIAGGADYSDGRSTSASIKVFDLQTGDVLKTLNYPAWDGNFGDVGFNHDGKLLFVSNASDESITIWAVVAR